jgi:hypothetical protein
MGGYESRTGAVLFAKNLDRVASFYSAVLGLTEANRADDHILLESPGFQLVVHRITVGGAAASPLRPLDARWRHSSRSSLSRYLASPSGCGNTRRSSGANRPTMVIQRRDGVMDSTRKATSFSFASTPANQDAAPVAAEHGPPAARGDKTIESASQEVRFRLPVA